MDFAKPDGTCTIRLGVAEKRKKAKKAEASNPAKAWSKSISAATFAPDGSLWIATDEHSQVLRLRRSGNDFALQGVFPLESLLDLRGVQKEEIDIEGLAADDAYLWVTGSHSSLLKMPSDGSADELAKAPKALRLDNTEQKPSRKLIARIPFSDEGISRRVKTKKKEKRQAALLPLRQGETELTRALQKDPHLGPFIKAGLPCKSNGFDVEGMARSTDKVYLGLRGPVIDDWAMLIEIEPSGKSNDSLKLKSQTDRGAPYRKIFLNLGGLGIRDLCLHNDTLYILAGPSMALDGPVCIFEIRSFAKAVRKKALKLDPILHLAYDWKRNHPEALVVLPNEKQTKLLVICDHPDKDRTKAGSIKCDLYNLPKTRASASSDFS